MNITSRLLTGNYGKGRGVMVPDMLVIHVTEGSASSVRSWFAAPVAQVSAHYMVCIDGTIDQFVREEDTAWHAGRVASPTAPLVIARTGINPNSYSIGIEHEGTGNAPLTPKQRDASLSLILDICRRRSIPIDRTHIVGHHEVYARKSCPGAISVDALVREAQLRDRSPQAVPKPPIVVWSEYAGDWLIVTRVVTDAEWYYVPLTAVRKMPVTRATTPLSQMPLVAP